MEAFQELRRQAAETQAEEHRAAVATFLAIAAGKNPGAAALQHACETLGLTLDEAEQLCAKMREVAKLREVAGELDQRRQVLTSAQHAQAQVSAQFESVVTKMRRELAAATEQTTAAARAVDEVQSAAHRADDLQNQIDQVLDPERVERDRVVTTKRARLEAEQRQLEGEARTLRGTIAGSLKPVHEERRLREVEARTVEAASELAELAGVGAGGER